RRQVGLMSGVRDISTGELKYNVVGHFIGGGRRFGCATQYFGARRLQFSSFQGLTIPSFLIRKCTVDRFMSRRAAAPLGPAITHFVSFSAARMCARSASSMVCGLAKLTTARFCKS